VRGWSPSCISCTCTLVPISIADQSTTFLHFFFILVLESKRSASAFADANRETHARSHDPFNPLDCGERWPALAVKGRANVNVCQWPKLHSALRKCERALALCGSSLLPFPPPICCATYRLRARTCVRVCVYMSRVIKSVYSEVYKSRDTKSESWSEKNRNCKTMESRGGQGDGRLEKDTTNYGWQRCGYEIAYAAIPFSPRAFFEDLMQ